jgi:RNA processing factor Prp31
LDKDINTFAMRIKEWYSWHYPELARIITENVKYVQLVKLIGVTYLLILESRFNNCNFRRGGRNN